MSFLDFASHRFIADTLREEEWRLFRENRALRYALLGRNERAGFVMQRERTGRREEEKR